MIAVVSRWRTRRIDGDEDRQLAGAGRRAPERVVTPLELFFDLVYVFAIADTVRAPATMRP